MTIRRVLITATVVTATLMAQAAPAAAQEFTDEQFLAAVADRGLDVGTDKQTIAMAEQMCTILGGGDDQPVEAALIYVKDQSGLPDEDVATFAGIAAQVYCPELVPK